MTFTLIGKVIRIDLRCNHTNFKVFVSFISKQPYRSSAFLKFGPGSRTYGDFVKCNTVINDCSYISRNYCHTSVDSTILNRRLKKKPIYSKRNKVALISDCVVNQLETIYGIESDVAYSNFKSLKFGKVSDDVIISNIHLLKKHDVPADQLKRNPWILGKNPKKLQVKFQNLTKPAMFDSVSDGLGFCHFSVKKILQHQKFLFCEAPLFPSHRNRFYYISELINVPVAHIVEKVRGPDNVIYRSMDKIRSVIELLKCYNVPGESIASDLWTLSYLPGRLEPKLKAVKEAGWHNPKPWAGRANDGVIERTILKYQKEKSLLEEYGTLERLLAFRLNCTEDEVKDYMNLKCMSHSLNLINSKLTFLFAHGFTPEDIKRCPSVLQCSVHRMERRIQEFEKLGCDVTSTYVLNISNEMYRRLHKRLKRKKSASSC